MKNYKLTIEILSPVHIGDLQGRLSTIEFFQDDQAVYLINEKALAAELAAEGTVDGFVKHVETEGSPSLDSFLETLGLSRANHLRRVVAYRRIPKGEPVKVSNLQPFITDSVYRQPYIPGSSLKGAIRGAILFSLAGSRQDIFDKVLHRKIKNPGKNFDSLLQARLFGKSNAHADWLRFLQITDAYPDSYNCTEVREARVISLNKDRGYHYGASGAKLFVEVIKPGVKFSARVKYDEEAWDNLIGLCGREAPFVLDKWLEFCREKCRRIITADREFYLRAGLNDIAAELSNIADRGANLRLGWGSGLLSTTLVLYLPQEKRIKLRKLYFKDCSHLYFPQSRKAIIANSQPVTTLGWIKLTLN